MAGEAGEVAKEAWVGETVFEGGEVFVCECGIVDIKREDKMRRNVIWNRKVSISPVVSALLALKQLWQNVPPSWNRDNDPCGSQWEGIACKASRVTSIKLSSMRLIGTLSGDIQGLSELQTLILTGCSFNGKIPDTIGSLSKLIFLSLNSNSFIGTIPQTMGNLTRLYWLDLADNQLTGAIPISNGTAFGLDSLVHTKHFHLGRNQFSGEIPPQLFNENMTTLHMLLDNNQFTGTIPTTLGLVKTLEVVRLDWNYLTGSVPSSINSLTILTDMDMSNNSYDVSDVPLWVTALPSLTTLVLKNNGVSGILDLGATRSSQLKLIDLQNNNISAYTSRPADDSLELMSILGWLVLGRSIIKIGLIKSRVGRHNLDEDGSESRPKPNKKSHLGTILGSIGGSLLAVLTAVVGVWQRKYVCKAVKCTITCICYCCTCNKGCNEGIEHDKYQKGKSQNPTLEIEEKLTYRVSYWDNYYIK
ncbi:hypothetical protein KSS87_014138 [Heliosperma pusillum]|nr:hypothetical protein KSS87_014138 [Heliosperma pusillum]